MSAPSQRGSIVDDDVHGDGMVRRHAGQARIAHASVCCMFVPRDRTEVYTVVAPGPVTPILATQRGQRISISRTSALCFLF